MADTGDVTDWALIERARQGERAARNDLFEQYRPFVFNVALKMFGDRDDAEDLTQEVLIRAVTSLDSFRGDSAFTTWLYRITVNHFLKTRRRGMEFQSRVDDFAGYFDAVDAVADEPSDTEPIIADRTVDELRIRCTTGMLMCLDREQRITFILGAMFGLSHTVGADALGISPGNFRIRLHRARRQLGAWMNQRCGLVNPANACRCHKKARGFVRLGLVDPARMTFTRDHQQRVEQLVKRDAADVMQAVEDLHDRVFRDHPAQRSEARVVDEILGSAKLCDFFDLA
jgi:RNA polymerase sigma factor (sigma-70 family)